MVTQEEGIEEAQVLQVSRKGGRHLVSLDARQEKAEKHVNTECAKSASDVFEDVPGQAELMERIIPVPSPTANLYFTRADLSEPALFNWWKDLPPSPAEPVIEAVAKNAASERFCLDDLLRLIGNNDQCHLAIEI